MNKLKFLRLLYKKTLATPSPFFRSRIGWELIQTIVGLTVGSFAIFWVKNIDVWEAEGVIVLKAFGDKKKYWGAVSFGTIIIGDILIGREKYNSIFVHEFGHSIQSRVSGPIYLFKYGIPSFIDAMSDTEHNNHWAEQDANLRSYDYFNQKEDFLYWPENRFPISAFSKLHPPQKWEYIPPLFPIVTVIVNLRKEND